LANIDADGPLPKTHVMKTYQFNLRHASDMNVNVSIWPLQIDTLIYPRIFPLISALIYPHISPLHFMNFLEVAIAIRILLRAYWWGKCESSHFIRACGVEGPLSYCCLASTNGYPKIKTCVLNWIANRLLRTPSWWGKCESCLFSDQQWETLTQTSKQIQWSGSMDAARPTLSAFLNLFLIISRSVWSQYYHSA
jgi:hypothetical protein